MEHVCLRFCPCTTHAALNRSSQHLPELVEAALDDCLQELGLDYLDVSPLPLRLKATDSDTSAALPCPLPCLFREKYQRSRRRPLPAYGEEQTSWGCCD
jgi:hypothetical protein